MAAATNEEAQVATRPRMSPSLPTQLNREPSQQELEVAQHLIEHSQGVSATQPGRDAYPAASSVEQAGPGESERRENGASDVHHDLRDVQAFTAQRYPSPSQSGQGASMPQQPRMVPSGTVPGGQMCRYDFLGSMLDVSTRLIVM